MESVRDSRTDERLDDLNRRVDDGFRELKADLRSEVGSVRQELGPLRESVSALGGEFHALQRTMVYGFVGITGTIVGGFAAMLTVLAALR